MICDGFTGPHIRLDAPASLRETAAAIAGSAGYVGASMHGYVTACAYDVPGVMVARPAHRKFGGLVGQLGRPQDMVRDWPSGLSALVRSLAAPAGTIIPDAVHQAIAAHWSGVAHCLKVDDPQRRPAQRSLLAEYLRFGLDGAGPDWAFGGFARRPG